MTELSIDTGLRRFSINGAGTLTFNPSDPNLYHRFLQAGGKIEAIQQQFAQAAKQAADGPQVLALLNRADRETKALLNETFGPPNDFETALQGVNLLAVCRNGQRAITNLLAALQPVLEQGARSFYQAAADAAVAQADADRAARESAPL